MSEMAMAAARYLIVATPILIVILKYLFGLPADGEPKKIPMTGYSRRELSRIMRDLEARERDQRHVKSVRR